MSRPKAAHSADTSHTSAPASRRACSTPLVAKGRDLVRSGRHATPPPVPAIGQVPDAETVFVGCLLWSAPDAAAAVLELVVDDDLASPALAEVVGTVRQLAQAGRPCDAQAAMDQLGRHGAVRRETALAVMTATTAGAVPQAARFYGAAVVAKALRRKVESFGHALTEASRNAAEGELSPLAAQAAANIAGCAHRLSVLRGEAL
ncbi:MAG: DnaB-like helicase N-terminal domain-containing protein [Mycobacterium sp.]